MNKGGGKQNDASTVKIRDYGFGNGVDKQGGGNALHFSAVAYGRN